MPQRLLEDGTVFRLCCLFDCDVEDLKHKLYLAKKVTQRKAQCRTELSSILDFITFLKPYKEVFHQLFHLCRIAIAFAGKQCQLRAQLLST